MQGGRQKWRGWLGSMLLIHPGLPNVVVSITVCITRLGILGFIAAHVPQDGIDVPVDLRGWKGDNCCALGFTRLALYAVACAGR